MPPEGSGSKGMDRPAITVSAFGPATGLLSNSAGITKQGIFLMILRTYKVTAGSLSIAVLHRVHNAMAPT